MPERVDTSWHEPPSIPGVLAAKPGWDHQWPAELDDGSCENCGLPYAEWSDPETLWCQVGPR